MSVNTFRGKLLMWGSVIAVLAVSMFALTSISEAAIQKPTTFNPLIGPGPDGGDALYFNDTDTSSLISGGGAAGVYGVLAQLKKVPVALGVAITAVIGDQLSKTASQYTQGPHAQCLYYAVGEWSRHWGTLGMYSGLYDCSNPPSNARPICCYSGPGSSNWLTPSPSPSATPIATPTPVPVSAAQIDPPDTVNYQTAPAEQSAPAGNGYSQGAWTQEQPSNSASSSPLNNCTSNPAICGSGSYGDMSAPAQTQASGTTSGSGDPGAPSETVNQGVTPPTTAPNMPPG